MTDLAGSDVRKPADPAAGEIAWYLGRDGRQYGPVSDADFRRLYDTGQFVSTDLVWREGFDQWCTLESLLPVAPTPPTVDRAAPQAAPVYADSGRPASNETGMDTPEEDEDWPEAVPARKNGQAARERGRAIRRGSRALGRGLAWTAILGFFAATLWSADKVASTLWPAYPGLFNAQGYLKTITVMLPSFSERSLQTAPVGGFGNSIAETDAALQKSAVWQVLKKYHHDWYETRVRQATDAVLANVSEGEIANTLMQEVVKLRRRLAEQATAAPYSRLKSIATMFTTNLAAMRAQSIDTCYQFVSAGEGAPAVVALLQSAATTSPIQAQLVSIFEAIEEGRKLPRIYPKPKAEDYDALVVQLEARGWKPADIRLFSDSAALAKASPDTVCRLVTEWFESQLEIKDEDTQHRLIVDSLKPVVGG